MKDIVTVVKEYGIDVKKEGSVLRAFCPFHNDSGKPNLTLYPETNSWYCFANCGGGDVVQFISRIENISREAAKFKITNVNVDLEDLQQKLDGLEVTQNNLTFNDQLSITVSNLFKDYLVKNPKNLSLTLELMKEIDLKLLMPIDVAKMQQILEELSNKLK